MKRSGILNAQLSRAVAQMGHGQKLVIADAGLPVPDGVPCIDLAVTLGVPSIWPVLDAVLEELEVERALIATEASPVLKSAFSSRLGRSMDHPVPHEEFKALCSGAVAVVRTGEATPYANVVLVSGVPF